MGVLQQPPHGDVLLQKRERDVLNQGEHTQGATATTAFIYITITIEKAAKYHFLFLVLYISGSC